MILEVHAQIAIICLANAGILSAVLLARRRQMPLARCHFAHRAKYRVWPTLVRHDLWAPYFNNNSLEIFDFPYSYSLQQFIP